MPRGVALDRGFTVGAERILLIDGFSRIPGIRNFDLLPDGERFIATFPADQADSDVSDRPAINIALNWFEELQERVPVP